MTKVNIQDLTGALASSASVKPTKRHLVDLPNELLLIICEELHRSRGRYPHSCERGPWSFRLNPGYTPLSSFPLVCRRFRQLTAPILLRNIHICGYNEDSEFKHVLIGIRQLRVSFSFKEWTRSISIAVNFKDDKLLTRLSETLAENLPLMTHLESLEFKHVHPFSRVPHFPLPTLGISLPIVKSLGVTWQTYNFIECCTNVEEVNFVTNARAMDRYQSDLRMIFGYPDRLFTRMTEMSHLKLAHIPMEEISSGGLQYVANHLPQLQTLNLIGLHRNYDYNEFLSLNFRGFKQLTALYLHFTPIYPYRSNEWALEYEDNFRIPSGGSFVDYHAAAYAFVNLAEMEDAVPLIIPAFEQVPSLKIITLCGRRVRHPEKLEFERTEPERTKPGLTFLVRMYHEA